MNNMKDALVAQPRLFITAIGVGAFLSHFTAGVVTVSLPELTNTFHEGMSAVQWVVTGYLLIITIMLPIMGKLGDRYGHRRIHNAGYVLFTVSSVLVALSPNLTALLVLRAVQAIGASMFQATNMALITIMLAKEARGRALGLVSMAVALGGVSGPILGGMIAQWLSWQWLFLMHVPAAIAATYLAFKHIPKTAMKPQAKVSFDGIGALLFAALTGLIIVGVNNIGGWQLASVQMWAVIGSAIVLLLLFLTHTKRRDEPFLPLRIFREPAVSSGLLVSFAAFMLVNALQVVLPFYLTEALALPLFAVGALTAAYPAALAFTGPIAGQLSDRLKPYSFPIIGLVLMGFGSLAFALWLDDISPVIMACLLAVIGIGMGLIASPNNNIMMSNVSFEHVGATSGLIALSRNAGMAFGAAIGLGAIPTGYTMVFSWNVFICLAAIILFIYANRISSRKSERNSGY